MSELEVRAVAASRPRRSLALLLRSRTLLWLAAAAVAVHLLLPQVGELRQTLEALRSVHWGWLGAASLAVALNYVAQALAQMGAVDRPLGLGRTVVVQVAGAFVSRLAPQGIGNMGINERYLEREGLDRRMAVGAVATNFGAGFVVHVLSLLAVAALVGGTSVGFGGEPVHIVRRWPVLLAVPVLTTLLAVAIWSPLGRRRLLAPALATARELLSVLSRPVRALQLFGGSLGVTLTYALALGACLRACGASAPLLNVLAVYLGATALAVASPTPGGLGALEAALVAGLTALRIPAGAAVAGVLVFRLLTFWLPIAPGFIAFRYLQSRKAL